MNREKKKRQLPRGQFFPKGKRQKTIWGCTPDNLEEIKVDEKTRYKQKAKEKGIQ